MTTSKPIIDPISGLAKRLAEEKEESDARQRMLDRSAPYEGASGGDKQLDASQQHKPAGPNANFDQKIYYYPEEFIALRRELQENWRDFFETVSPVTGTSPAWCMAFDAQQFIGFCNGMTGLAVQFDSENVSGICREFLNAFRKMRNVSPII